MQPHWKHTMMLPESCEAFKNWRHGQPATPPMWPNEMLASGRRLEWSTLLYLPTCLHCWIGKRKEGQSRRRDTLAHQHSPLLHTSSSSVVLYCSVLLFESRVWEAALGASHANKSWAGPDWGQRGLQHEHLFYGEVAVFQVHPILCCCVRERHSSKNVLVHPCPTYNSQVPAFGEEASGRYEMSHDLFVFHTVYC